MPTNNTEEQIIPSDTPWNTPIPLELMRAIQNDVAIFTQALVMAARNWPRRIQQHRTKGWRKPKDVIAVTRGTEYGNPFRVGDQLPFQAGMRPGQGSTWGGTLTITPALAVALYAQWTLERVGVEQIRKDLAGKSLMCWCPPAASCHADWLLKVANGGTL
jgi:hypothetical protein